MPRAAAPKYSTGKYAKLEKWTLSKLFVLLKLHARTVNIGRNINIFIHTNHYAMPQTTASNSHDTDEDDDIEILNDAPHKTLSVSIRISTIFKPECICLTTIKEYIQSEQRWSFDGTDIKVPHSDVVRVHLWAKQENEKVQSWILKQNQQGQNEENESNRANHDISSLPGTENGNEDSDLILSSKKRYKRDDNEDDTINSNLNETRQKRRKLNHNTLHPRPPTAAQKKRDKQIDKKFLKQPTSITSSNEMEFMQENNNNGIIYDIDQNIPESPQKKCPITNLSKEQIIKQDANDFIVNSSCGHFFSKVGLIGVIKHDYIQQQRRNKKGNESNNAFDLSCDSIGNNRKPFSCSYTDCSIGISDQLLEEILNYIENHDGC